MKTLAILASLAVAAPAFACPDMDHAEAPKTATKDKAKSDKPATPANQAQKPSQKDQKPTDAAKTKDTAKKPDKVSQN